MEYKPDPLRRLWRSFSAPSHQRLGEQAVAMGWIAAERLEEVLRDKPADVPIGPFLVQRRLITPEQLTEIIGAPPFYFCAACLKRFEIDGAAHGVRYCCPQCHGVLMPESGTETLPAEALDVDRETLPDEARAAAEIPENIVGRFVRIKLLGRGGMGAVWKCFDRDLRRFVAVKFLEGAGETTIQRFLREAKVAARLEHPQIARVYDSGGHQGQHYIVMQLIEGETLSHARPIQESLALVAKAARAIHTAHEQGIIHRDIKPENMMRTSQGDVVVLDFGLAREVNVGSASGAIMGTPPYMSPEQIRGQAHRVDARSDVYSLGATLFHLATGAPPFAGPDLADFIRQIHDEDPALPGSLPWEVRTIILKAMEKEAARRYPSAKEFAEDIERYLAGEPILARPSGLLYRWQKRARRQPALFASVGLLVLAALLTGTFWLGSYVQARQDLERLLGESDRKLQNGDLQGAHEAIVRAGAIDPAAAQPILKKVQDALDRQKIERERLEALDRERRAVDPLLQELRDLDQTGWIKDYSSKTEELMQRSNQISEEWSGAWLARGWAKRLRSKYRGDEAHLIRAAEDLERCLAMNGPYRDEAIHQRGLVYAERVRRRRSDFQASFTQKSGYPMQASWSRSNSLDEETRGWVARALDDLKSQKDPYGQALVDYLQGRYREAIERLETAGSLEAQLLLVQCTYYGLGDAKLQEDVEFLAHRTQRPDAMRLAALMNLTHGSLVTAEQFFTELIALEKNHAPNWLNRGVCRRKQGKAESAIEDYNRVLQLSPDNIMAIANRGHAKGDLGNNAGAEEDYTRALAIKPSASLYSDRARARVRQGKHDGAIEDATMALSEAPDDTWALINRGIAYLAKGETDPACLEKAIADFTRGIELNDRFSEAYYLRGSARLYAQRASEALADFTKAFKLNPRLGQLLTRVELCLDQLEKRPEASSNEFIRSVMKELEEALQAAPSAPPTDKLLARVRQFLR